MPLSLPKGAESIHPGGPVRAAFSNFSSHVCCHLDILVGMTSAPSRASHPFCVSSGIDAWKHAAHSIRGRRTLIRNRQHEAALGWEQPQV
jgi:hypothetical protein